VVEQDGVKRSAYSAELVDVRKPWTMSCTATAATQERSRKIRELVEAAGPDDGSWRWRIFKLRAEIDGCIACGNPADEKFAELCSIYKADGGTIPCLIPPAQSVWKSALSGKVDTAQGD
ncbi:MAG: hypothetical protein MJ025_05130, partial [Victivallaceae bacterium]|nr:hypothetical protein [Victivallaceae bacterium]